MARAFHVVWAGRHQRSTWDALCDGYRRRIARYAAIHDRPVKARGGGDVKSRRRAEGKALRAALPDPCFTIALDRRGTSLSSAALARRLDRLQTTWPHPIAFLIGSDVGLDPPLVEEARMVLSFGPLTLAHELARLTLYEQLYRSLSITRGINYHRPSL
ncbi:MAG: 23S rRNA (pseudouridine(1915)-N(3))-methyltransferase RlmH [Acidobacteria bacterium]|nr:MAG: 23S rRNA (pseudouridine(1915)-N(3))-methyltransferase RlmH [Acidobacteriota bacterium]